MVVVVSKPRDADRRALMRVKLGAAGVEGYRVVDGIECRAHRPCVQQHAALIRAVREETKSNLTQVLNSLPARTHEHTQTLHAGAAQPRFPTDTPYSVCRAGLLQLAWRARRQCAPSCLALLGVILLILSVILFGRACEQAGSLLAPRDWPPSAAMLGQVTCEPVPLCAITSAPRASSSCRPAAAGRCQLQRLMVLESAASS